MEEKTTGIMTTRIKQNMPADKATAFIQHDRIPGLANAASLY